MGENGTWIADDGRRWRTKCDTAATGRGACSSYVWATVHVATRSGFAQRSDWMFNNIVMFASR